MACVPDKKPKLKIVPSGEEKPETNDEAQEYERLIEQSKRRHPSALPALAEIEYVADKPESGMSGDIQGNE